MLAKWLQQEEANQDVAFVTSEGTVSWSEFYRLAKKYAEQFAPLSGQRVGLLLEPTPESFAQLFGLIDANAHLFLMAASTSKANVKQWSADFGLVTVYSSNGKISLPTAEQKDGSPDAITILTSGTTGKPKAVEHTFQSLTRPVRINESARGAVWLLTFRPHLYAGLQVTMQCLLNHGTLVMPKPNSEASDVAALAADANVEYASATPSYWRWLLTLGGNALSRMSLKQITLGGEAADQATLDALKSTFSSSRIVHIYATTELGRCFSVSDGIAGFPATLLDAATPDGVEMKVEDGELIVRSANAMSGYDSQELAASPQSDWFSTSDLVAIEGNRVHFVGRKTDMINVGGNKVYPLEVETVVRSVPGVADTRVYGEASSLVGELVKCDVVVEVDFDATVVEQAVRAKTLAELANYQRPRFIQIVDKIPRTDAGKTKRQ